MKRFIFAAVAALLAAAVPIACLASGPRPIRDVHVVHFVLDGVSLSAFDRALAQGRMPTVRERFVEGGARFDAALSNFPSTSTTVYQSYATGLAPGHAGIPHLERFDRQTGEVIGYLTAGGHARINDDLINLRALTDPDIVEISPPTTIFEFLEGHPTAAVYSSFYRGASYVHPKRAPIAALWDTYVTGRKERVNVLAMKRAMSLFRGPSEKLPRYTIVGLYSTDILGHSYGPDASDVEDSLSLFDAFLEDFMALLDERGILAKTYIVISADHGMHESGELFDLKGALEAAGVRVKPGNPRAKDYTIYAANRGVASSHIYVKHDGGFEPIRDPEILRRHPKKGGGTVDLIELITGLDATELLIIRSGSRGARVYDREGRRADIASYEIAGEEYLSLRFDREKGDPLGYGDDPALRSLADGLPHAEREWLDATARAPYPDAPFQISQIFHDGRAGDAFITTRGRWGFKKVKAGNHGGMASSDMRVPLLIAGPDVPRGEFGAARAVDIFPLLVRWFDLDVPNGSHDGEDPFVAHGAGDPAAEKLAAVEQALDGSPPLLKMIGVADFVRRDIYPSVAPREFPRLKALAARELSRRSRLSAGLRRLLKSLEGQRSDGAGAREGSMDDHIEIVRRQLRWASGATRRMEDALTIFEKCGGSGCKDL